MKDWLEIFFEEVQNHYAGVETGLIHAETPEDTPRLTNFQEDKTSFEQAHSRALSKDLRMLKGQKQRFDGEKEVWVERYFPTTDL
jgi:hypothetical protein